MHRLPLAPSELVEGPESQISEESSRCPVARVPNTTRQPPAVQLGNYLDQAEDVVQPQKLFDLLAAFAQELDCPWTAYRPLVHRPNKSDLLYSPPITMLNYPNEWQKRYWDMGYDKTDPVIRKVRHRLNPLRWADVYADANTTENERRILEEASMFGLRSGITIPLPGPDDNFAIASFAKKANEEIPSDIITYLQLSALHFHIKVNAPDGRSGIQQQCGLSLREKECILWVSRGKSSWDIGRILGISENTVNFHIKNVMHKLGCNSRTVAVVNALKCGIIDS
ncbi:LuxR family transcriptional regulator [Ensifer sp. LCM 4579]|uniref:LuxR family transcriptional regulator n=1 Tax=Ensifer sp. LCM 4579 TaxID=1848292 RepID=UPI0009F595B4|nr:LuxR family transcriptional regulator [Ensifer sp. LCM 4579]